MDHWPSQCAKQNSFIGLKYFIDINVYLTDNKYDIVYLTTSIIFSGFEMYGIYLVEIEFFFTRNLKSWQNYARFFHKRWKSIRSCRKVLKTHSTLQPKFWIYFKSVSFPQKKFPHKFIYSKMRFTYIFFGCRKQSVNAFVVYKYTVEYGIPAHKTLFSFSSKSDSACHLNYTTNYD